MSYSPLVLQKAREIIDAAKRDLGTDLGGHSKLDLLADNMEGLKLSDLECILIELDHRCQMCSADKFPGFDCDKCDGETDPDDVDYDHEWRAFGPDYDDEHYGDAGDGTCFADPGGRSALRAAGPGNPRNLPCPNCEMPNRLTPADRARGYQCDSCADRAERGWD